MKGLPIPTQQGETLPEGLEKWSWCNVTTAAVTAEGAGPKSAAVLCRTDEDGEYLCSSKCESCRSDLNSIDCFVDYLLARQLVT